MPMSKNLNTYNDIVQVLSAARAKGGVSTYKLPSLGAAVAWRARAYYYRKLLSENARIRAGVKGFIPTTAWDDMLLETDGKGGVTIAFGRTRGQLVDEAGQSYIAPPVKIQVAEAEAIIASTPAPPLLPGEIDEFTLDLEESARRLLGEKGA